MNLRLLYTRLDLECAGSQAVLDGLTSIVSSLDEARSERQRAVEELQTKLGKIQEFARVAVSSNTHTLTQIIVEWIDTLMYNLIQCGAVLLCKNSIPMLR